MLRAAFRDLHGQRLHGFALLAALGDRSLAASAAAAALAEGGRHAADLRHPERAAAWLRARVSRSLPRSTAIRSAGEEADRREALRALGVPDFAFDALATLTAKQRVALVAASIERFEARDVEAILDESRPRLNRLLAEARRRYLAAALATLDAEPTDIGAPPGSLTARVVQEARRTMGVSEST